MRSTWQQTLIESVSQPQTLIQLLQLESHLSPCQKTVLDTFRCRVPRPFIDRMQRGNPHDPLLKQVLPLDQELTQVDGYSLDPLQENLYQPTAGMLQKYPGRVLLTLTGACAVNCRYCFRRHFPYHEHTFNQQRWQSILQHLRSDNTIHEVILSGGDPLMLKDEQLQTIIHDLETIQHISTLRIHTRLPIVIPDRITDSFCQMLTHTKLHTVLVTHINHAQEIDATVRHAISQLPAKVTLLNQSVLLKGVNDSTSALCDLSHACFNSGILPYYCHLLDPVAGTAHFDVNKTTAIKLINAARAQLPGYLVPRLTREIPNRSSKTIIA
jgi:L-lysine 2,3-aminomutase